MTKSIRNLFLQFHNAIKLDRPAGGQELLNEQQRLVRTLKVQLSKAGLPLDHFKQGSYAMKTMIRPTNGKDYDLDTALAFHCSATKYNDPTDLKQIVMDAIKQLTPRAAVEMKDPCIQVDYGKFHLDFAVYAQHPHPQNKGLQLAWGRRGSQEKSWENANPRILVELVNDKYEGQHNHWKRAQFIRIVRYLKRWKDENFPKRGNAAPTGILLTALVYEWMKPKRDSYGQEDDLFVLLDLLNKAGQQNYGVGYTFNLPLKSPKALFDDMQTGREHIANYIRKIGKLKKALIQANHHLNQNNVAMAAIELRQQFGNDFPTL